MLDKDVSKRIAMLEIYDHPWIKRYHRKDSYDEENSSDVPTVSEEEEEIDSDLEPLMFNI